MESIRQAAGFNQWMARSAAACTAGANHLALDPFIFEGAPFYYWPSLNDDGIIWPHGFSDRPMANVM